MQGETMASPLTMTVEEVCRELQVTRRSLERWRNDSGSDFPRPYRVGSSVRYLRSEVVGWLGRQRV